MAQLKRRKILVAAIGIATISYGVACSDATHNPTSGNLPGPPAEDAGRDARPPTSGNLPAPPDAGHVDAQTDATTDGATDDAEADAEVDGSPDAEDAPSGD